MTAGNEEARRQNAQARLDSSPALREEIDKAIADGRLPAAVVPPEAADELNKGGQLESVVNIDALEAIVRRVGRPPLLVENDQITLEALPEFAAGTDALIKGVEPNVRSVGRVEFVNHSMAWGGTGWVVDDPDALTRVVVTNRHVAKEIAARAADGSGVFLRSPLSGLRLGAELDFKEEVHSSPGDARPFRVTGIDYLADDASADVALLRITGDDLPSPLQLAEAEAEAGLRVALIGYPAYDPRNNRDDQARYFKDLYEVKRFAPGFVMQALSGPQALTHDCTSLGGNSGSPLISLEDGKVVGLHYSGLYGVANSAVGVGTLRKLVAGDRPLVVAVRKDPEELRKRESTRDGSHPADFFGGRKGYDPGFL
ncbi:MAG: endonuclease mitochondrial, partial [Kribbellaceae bacterium]|nr:endonuclease mitochondrial [Kribbellaceae bacterium]